MKCVFQFIGKDAGRYLHRCTAANCEREVRTDAESCSILATCRSDSPIAIPHSIPPPSLPIFEIERRLSICKSGCEHWNEEKQGCKVCGTCGSGQAMLNGLLKDPAKKCPHPNGNKWGPGFDPIKVAFLAPSLLLGGAERWIASLARHFDPAILWPQYIALTQPKDRSPVIEGWLPKHTRVVSAELLPQIMEQVDVLIAWGTQDLAHRTKGAKCRIVEVQHGTIGFGDYQRRLAQAGIDAEAVLTAVGEACLDNFPEEYRGKVTVIQNGAETERLQPIIGREAKRKELGILPGERMCLYIGRISKVKNLDGLAAAMDLLPGWRLVVVGPEYQKHHCLGNAIVLPSQEHLGDLLAAADVFAAPSHHEANSLAVIEAWLAGVPTVTTDYPAAKAMEAKHGKMSWLVPVNPSPRVLADAIEEAAKWRGTLPVLNVQGIALKHYTAAAMAKRWQYFIVSKMKDTW